MDIYIFCDTNDMITSYEVLI